MSIKFCEIECNECRSRMDDGEDSYCTNCYTGLEDKISGLEDDISNLESDKDTLQQEKDELTGKLQDLENEKFRSEQ